MLKELQIVEQSKLKKHWKKKSKIIRDVTDHILYCSKIVTNDFHRVPKVYLEFLCIKTNRN